METDLNKARILLKSLIFHYHGMEEDERLMLENYAEKLDCKEELRWALDFISRDYMSAYERSKEFLNKNFRELPEETRLQYLMETWEDNHKKGYVTEMETMAMMNLAKDWSIDKQFMAKINQI